MPNRPPGPKRTAQSRSRPLSIIARYGWQFAGFICATAIAAIISGFAWDRFSSMSLAANLHVVFDLDRTPFVPATDWENDKLNYPEFRPIYTVTNQGKGSVSIVGIDFRTYKPNPFFKFSDGSSVYTCSFPNSPIFTSPGLDPEGDLVPPTLAVLPLVLSPDESQVIIPDFFLRYQADCRGQNQPDQRSIKLTRDLMNYDLSTAIFHRKLHMNTDVPYKCRDLTEYELVFRLHNGKSIVVRQKHYIITSGDAWNSADNALICPGQTNVPGDTMRRIESNRRMREADAATQPSVNAEDGERRH